MLLRPVWKAAIIVVPEPQNGSRTVSSTNENILTNLVASSIGNGAGWCLVDAPGMFHICWNQRSNSSFEILLASRCALDGFRYPPGFRCMRMYSMSFLMIALGSYGLPKNLDPLATS